MEEQIIDLIGLRDTQTTDPRIVSALREAVSRIKDVQNGTQFAEEVLHIIKSVLENDIEE